MSRVPWGTYRPTRTPRGKAHRCVRCGVYVCRRTLRVVRPQIGPAKQYDTSRSCSRPEGKTKQFKQKNTILNQRSHRLSTSVSTVWTEWWWNFQTILNDAVKKTATQILPPPPITLPRTRGHTFSCALFAHAQRKPYYCRAVGNNNSNTILSFRSIWSVFSIIPGPRCWPREITISYVLLLL